MAKRFTDTEKWKDEWFLELEPTLKMLWIYILDTCDHAGVWKSNFKLASYSIGAILDKQSAKKAFGSRIKELTPDKWHVTKFISYQYKGFLNPSNKAHKGVINSLILNGIDLSPFVDPLKPLRSQDALDQRGLGIGVGIGLGSFNSSSSPKKGTESLNPVRLDQIIQLFNDTLAGKVGQIKYCYGLSGPQAEDFLTTTSFEQFTHLETWEEIFKNVSASPFLCGESKGGSGWTVTLNWLVVHGNALKVLNGSYPAPVNSKSAEANMDYITSVELD
jgi:hypothetical protein